MSGLGLRRWGRSLSFLLVLVVIAAYFVARHENRDDREQPDEAE